MNSNTFKIFHELLEKHSPELYAKILNEDLAAVTFENGQVDLNFKHDNFTEQEISEIKALFQIARSY